MHLISRWLVMILICAQILELDSGVFAQSSRTAPLPIRQVGRPRLFNGRNRRDDDKDKTPEKTPSTIPGIPPAQLANNAPDPTAAVPDPLLAKVKKAIDINSRRYLSPDQGHTPWMILHGVLALRQDYKIRVNNQLVNGLQYITATNPIYRGNIPNPLNPDVGLVPVQGYWFESTAYGGRAHPFQVMFAFEGHVNQSLAVLSTCDLPESQTFVVHDSQRPGQSKTITMRDMLEHAKKTIAIGNPYELAWTLWFFSNYMDQNEKWTDMRGQTWTMEQLLATQINAPIVVNDPMKGPPCGGTHALFAMACACNSFQKKFGNLTGTWNTARRTLDYYIEAARVGQNSDGSMSNGYFSKYNQMAPTYGDRLKTSGHMLEWLMMALPPERLQEPWVRKGIERLADDLISGQSQPLDHEHTGSLFHAVHALVLYRNRMEPLQDAAPEQRAEVPKEQMNPAPGSQPAAGQPVPGNSKTSQAQPTGQPDPIRLLGPGPKRLTPSESKPLLKPITNTQESEPLKPGDTPAASPQMEKQPAETPSKPPLLVPMPPELAKPVSTPKPMPASGEPASPGAVVQPLQQEEGATEHAPLFGDEPAAAKSPPAPPMPVPMNDKPEAGPAKPPETTKTPAAPLVPSNLPEPTPRQPPSAGD